MPKLPLLVLALVVLVVALVPSSAAATTGGPREIPGWYDRTDRGRLADHEQCRQIVGHYSRYFRTTVPVTLTLLVDHTAANLGRFYIQRFWPTHDWGLGQETAWLWNQPANWITGRYTLEHTLAPGYYAYNRGGPSDDGLGCHYWLTADPPVTILGNDAFFIR